MRAAESRLTGWKRRDRGANPASCLAFLLSALFGCLLRPAFRKLTMVAVAVALAVAPLPAALVHAAPDSAGQLSLAEQEAAEHGHSHDEADGADHSAHHKHGHDPADHSHQYAFLAGASSQWGLPPAQRWPCALNGRPDAAIGLGIERPPKRIMSL